MKNLLNFCKFQLVICAFGFFLGSCEENNPNPSTPGNTNTNTEYNNEKFAIKNGFFQNNGTVDYFFDDEAEDKTHFGSTFILTDGNPTIKNDKRGAKEPSFIPNQSGFITKAKQTICNNMLPI